MDLRGKAALVTGSATGIGRATALALARRGCHVVVNYTRSESEARTTVSDVEALGARALLHRCDVVDDEAVRAMVAACDRELGRLDVLVNAAGTTHFAPFDDLEAITPEIWDRIFNVNVRGTFFATRAAVPLLKRSGNGARSEEHTSELQSRLHLVCRLLLEKKKKKKKEKTITNNRKKL